MNKLRIGMVIATVVAGLFGTAALAATWTVDAAQPDDSQCVNPTYLCMTIGAAVAGATAGDTINVQAGTYYESVNVGKQLTINGAQANVDACDRTGDDESIVIDAATMFNLTGGSAGTIINGFTFQGGDKQLQSSSGPIDNVQLLNNRHLEFTGSGVFLNDNGDDVTIDQCLIDGASAGSGGILHLDTDSFDGFYLLNSCLYGGTYGFFADGNRNVGTSGTRSSLFDGNLFDGSLVGMLIGVRALDGATISGNRFVNAGYDGILGGPKDTLITENVFEGNGRAGITFRNWNDSDVAKGAVGNTVSQNCFAGNGYVQTEGAAIRTDQQPNGQLATNTFNNNNIKLNALGFFNKEADTIDATSNYWGAADGPGGPDGTGSGDGVDGGGGGGAVTFSPFLAALEPTAPVCGPPPAIPTASKRMLLLMALGLMVLILVARLAARRRLVAR